jgi:type II pantothenate kinase
VDLRIGDVYPQGGIALRPEATAASFGKLRSREPADLAQALVALVGENVGALCLSVAQAMAVSTLVFGGSPVSGSSTLSDILEETVATAGREARFLPNGRYCGAVGAALSAEASA